MKKLKKRQKILGILEEARARIAKGWCQGPYATDRFGGVVKAKNPEASNWCAFGAVLAASPDGYVYPCGPMKYLNKVVKKMYMIDGVGPIHSCISQLNEAPGTTQSTMLAVFDKAISKLKRKINETQKKEKAAGHS